MFGLEILQIVATAILVTIVTISFVFSTGIIEIVSAAFEANDPSMVAEALFSPAIIDSLITHLVAALIVGMLISAFFSAAFLIQIDSGTKRRFSQVLSTAFTLSPMVVLAIIVTQLLIFGSLGIFLLPAIAVLILLAFVLFEIILEKSSLSQSIRNSYAIMTSQFKNVFFSGLVFFLVIIAISLVFDVISTEENAVLMLILQMPVNLLVNWMALAYFTTLYREARVRTDLTQTKHPIWMYVVSGLGWLIIILLLTQLWGYIGRNFSDIQSTFDDIVNEELDQSSDTNWGDDQYDMLEDRPADDTESFMFEETIDSEQIDRAELENLIQ